MTPRSVARFADLVGGALRGDPGATVTGACTDSRRVAPGDAFFAIRGENVDGHDYCTAALERAAACVVVERPLDLAGPQVVVSDAVAAMGAMARGLVRELDLPILALTGSVGKTTTRELLAAVLRESTVPAVAGENLNTEIGVPLALARVEPGSRVLVLEYAMRGLGQIRYLAEIAPPRVSAVLNVRSSHIEILGSRDAIAAAKAEILECTLPDGVCCVNRDDDYAEWLIGRANAPVLTFGTGPEAEVRAEDIVAGPTETRFTLRYGGEAGRVRIPVPGAHLVENALCAAAMAIAAGYGALESIARGIEAFEPGAHRGQAVAGRDGIVILDDCYNAAPDSMRAALAVLAAHDAGGGRRVAVLGDMLELGGRAEPEHAAIGALAAEAGLGLLVTVGARARGIAAAACEAGLAEERIATFDDAPGVLANLESLVRPGDVVLVKASRGIRLERIVEALREEARP